MTACVIQPLSAEEEPASPLEIDRVNDTDFDFRSARVIGHGSRREQYEQARRWRSRYVSMGHFYTGRIRAPIAPLLFP